MSKWGCLLRAAPGAGRSRFGPTAALPTRSQVQCDGRPDVPEPAPRRLSRLLQHRAEPSGRIRGGRDLVRAARPAAPDRARPHPHARIGGAARRAPHHVGHPVHTRRFRHRRGLPELGDAVHEGRLGSVKRLWLCQLAAAQATADHYYFSARPMGLSHLHGSRRVCLAPPLDPLFAPNPGAVCASAGVDVCVSHAGEVADRSVPPLPFLSSLVSLGPGWGGSGPSARVSANYKLSAVGGSRSRLRGPFFVLVQLTAA